MFKAIPKTVRLPGFKVVIKQVEHEDFADDFGARCKAAWVHEEMTIYLDSSRPIRKRRADLAHELGHVFMDWQADVLAARGADAKG
jgi:Zn-dependent peptidase ImmA (M78 family)